MEQLTSKCQRLQTELDVSQEEVEQLRSERKEIMREMEALRSVLAPLFAVLNQYLFTITQSEWQQQVRTDGSNVVFSDWAGRPCLSSTAPTRPS